MIAAQAFNQIVELSVVQPALESIAEKRPQGLAMANALSQPVRDPHPAGDKIHGKRVLIGVRLEACPQHRRGGCLMQGWSVDVILVGHGEY